MGITVNRPFTASERCAVCLREGVAYDDPLALEITRDYGFHDIAGALILGADDDGKTVCTYCAAHI